MDPRQLLEVLKGIFGLPDAPRGWFVELAGFLVGTLGFVAHRLDAAFFLLWEAGKLICIIIVHVDDLALAHDGSAKMMNLVRQLREKYRFGSWEKLWDKPEGANYTGKKLRIIDEEKIGVSMPDFINGRLDYVEQNKKDDPHEEATPLEKADFRTGVGGAHWVTSQYRIDKAFDVNQMQKQQNHPLKGDLTKVNKIIKEMKETAEFEYVIQRVEEPMAVATWSDSSLYGVKGEPLEDDDLQEYDRHKVRSQAGALVGVVAEKDLKSTEEVAVSFVDQRSRATHRAVISTFAAETAAALDAFGMGYYVRTFLVEIEKGWLKKGLLEYDEKDMTLRLISDCKSLYDHLCKDGAVPEDKWTAVYVAALKCGVSAGPGRDESKAGLMWVASRWQLADVLTKGGLSRMFREIMASGVTRFHELSSQALKRQRLKELEEKAESLADTHE